MIKLNGVKIKPTIFPDGTSQVIDMQFNTLTHNEIYWDFEQEREFMSILQILHYYEHSFNAHGFNTENILIVPFLPYGRQDKKLADSFYALSTFFKVLKQFFSLKEIQTLDAHSNLGRTHYGEGFVNIDPVPQIVKAIAASSPTLYCFPDTGAKKKYTKLDIFKEQDICSFTKIRNQKTGYIERLDLNELVNVEGETVLIVDDICDGGMTFKLCAEKLLILGAKEVNLYTTHGIYSKGIKTLKDSGISRIFNRKGEVE
jgi:ribose-phosphate pyrophosphokinase